MSYEKSMTYLGVRFWKENGIWYSQDFKHIKGRNANEVLINYHNSIGFDNDIEKQVWEKVSKVNLEKIIPHRCSLHIIKTPKNVRVLYYIKNWDTKEYFRTNR